jgi:hypothetical protein
MIGGCYVKIPLFAFARYIDHFSRSIFIRQAYFCPEKREANFFLHLRFQVAKLPISPKVQFVDILRPSSSQPKILY